MTRSDLAEYISPEATRSRIQEMAEVRRRAGRLYWLTIVASAGAAWFLVTWFIPQTSQGWPRVAVSGITVMLVLACGVLACDLVTGSAMARTDARWFLAKSALDSVATDHGVRVPQEAWERLETDPCAPFLCADGATRQFALSREGQVVLTTTATGGSTLRNVSAASTN